MIALLERGIGATRALVLDGDRIIAVHIERDDAGPRTGSVHMARLTTILEPGRRGIVTLGEGEALLEPLPKVTEGAQLRVEVVREALPEVARPRLPKLRLADESAALTPGPDLAARLAAAGHSVTLLASHGADALEAAGWSEAVEAARTGHVVFPAGLLTISPTPGMTVIDVDGPGDPVALAEAAAVAAAEAIARFDITGSIGVDFPTLAGKAARARLGELLDAHLPVPFERTAVNGYGFVQIIRPRLRPSFVEAVRAPGFAALELLRRAGRGTPGARTLVAHPSVIAWLDVRPALTSALARSVGGTVRLQADAGLAISGGDVVAR